MLSKLHQHHGSNKNYLKPRSDLNRVFGLNHFAGVVFYDAKGKRPHHACTFCKRRLYGSRGTRSRVVAAGGVCLSNFAAVFITKQMLCTYVHVIAHERRHCSVLCGAGFLEKNRDTFSQDLLNIIGECKFQYLYKLFKDDFHMVRVHCPYSTRTCTRTVSGDSHVSSVR